MAITPWNSPTSVAFSNLSWPNPEYPQAAQVAGLPNGGYAVVWEMPDVPRQDIRDFPNEFDGTGVAPLGEGSGVYASVFDANGILIPGRERIIVHTDSAYEAVYGVSDFSLHFHPVVTALPGLDDGFVVAYMVNKNNDYAHYDIVAKRYDAGGALRNSYPVVTGDVNGRGHLHPAITARAPINGNSNGFAVAWQDRTSSDDIKLKNFYADGSERPTITIFNASGTDDAPEGRNPDIATLTNGNIVVSYRVTGGGDFSSPTVGDVYFKIVDPSANNIVFEGHVRPDVGASAGKPQIAALANGRFVIVWEANHDIYAQLFNPGGESLRDAQRVNTVYSGDQVNPTVVGLVSGQYLIVWFDKNLKQLTGACFDDHGDRIDDEFTVMSPVGSTSRPDLSLLPNGRIVGAYDTHAANGDDNVLTQIFDPGVQLLLGRPGLTLGTSRGTTGSGGRPINPNTSNPRVR